MANDKRKKGCPNISCKENKGKTFFGADVNFCPNCGTPLVYVCSKCHKQIEDIDYSHRTCSLCEAKAEEHRQNVLNGAKNLGGKAIAIASPIAIGIVAKVGKNLQKDVVNKGVKVVENVAAKIIKK